MQCLTGSSYWSRADEKKIRRKFFFNIETYKFIQFYYVLMVQGNLEKKWKGNNNITIHIFLKNIFYIMEPL